ncbi:hypothetical protein GGI12_003985 [Dipsacomyces acuminosporus]|nr:hypothetical protein GGI12_003985 [Dipsacomyces acuminosporus]
MLDHILGKPSANIRRFQTTTITLLTILLLRRKRAPWGLKWLHRYDYKQSIWRVIIGWSTLLYVLKHLDDLLGLNAPEPLREYYSRSFYRACWIMTSLDAGFWTAMSIRPKILRDVTSLVFSLYYLVFYNRALEKVRKIRALITIDQLRVSWNKGHDHPVLRFFRYLHSYKLTIDKHVVIPSSSGHMEDGLLPANCHVYYAGERKTFESNRFIILNFPGSGFVSMAPSCHKDYLSAWAHKTQATIVSIDYAKAPEYPYPYAIDQSFEVYKELINSNGRCIGLNLPLGERQFPPVYFMCGEKDPMVDDTVIFATRIRRAKEKKANKPTAAVNKNGGLSSSSPPPHSHVDSSKGQGSSSPSYHDYKSSILYSRRHSQPRVIPSLNSSTQFYIGSTDVSDDEDHHLSNNAGTTSKGGHLLPASLRMSQFPHHLPNGTHNKKETADEGEEPVIIKVKLLAGMSHAFMQMYSLLPESKSVANTLGDWLCELLYGEHSITAYSRCASHINVASNPASKSALQGDDDDDDEDDEEEVRPMENEAIAQDSEDSKSIFDKGLVDKNGIELISAANMVRRRGHGLANPLN